MNLHIHFIFHHDCSASSKIVKMIYQNNTVTVLEWMAQTVTYWIYCVFQMNTDTKRCSCQCRSNFLPFEKYKYWLIISYFAIKSQYAQILYYHIKKKLKTIELQNTKINTLFSTRTYSELPSHGSFIVQKTILARSFTWSEVIYFPVRTWRKLHSKQCR